MQESPKAAKAFDDYYALGPSRSHRALHQIYREGTAKPPTRHIRTIAQWSVHHGWQQRVKDKDAEVAKAHLDRLKETAMEAGYALYWKRIADLNQLAEQMFSLLTIPGALSAKALNQYRGLLDDIAAEMGHRTQHVETSTQGEVIVRVQYENTPRPHRNAEAPARPATPIH